MAQLRRHKQPNGRMPANREVLDQRRKLVTQLGALSSLIEQNIQDLNQPMTVILGLNELILPQIEPGNNLAADLVGITRQIKRMSQIVDEVNNLGEERKKLLQVLGSLQSTSARLDGEATGTYSMREELK